MGLVFFAALSGIVSPGSIRSRSRGFGHLSGGVRLHHFAVLLVPATIGRLLQPFAFLRRGWIGAQIEGLTHSLINFRAAPVGLAASFAAAIFVQGANIAFYSAVARALGVHVGIWDMAVIVPLSALIQVVPVSVNGLGLREAAFTFFFTRLGLPAEAALLVSLEATAMILAFSLLGALLYIGRQFPARELGSAVQPAMSRAAVERVRRRRRCAETDIEPMDCGDEVRTQTSHQSAWSIFGVVTIRPARNAGPDHGSERGRLLHRVG